MVRAVLTGRSTVLGFDLAWYSSLSSERFCIFSLHDAIYIVIFWLPVHLFLYLSVSWVWWDWPLMWLTITTHCPSVPWHCWWGHLTHKIVSEMTYNVSSGTLSPTIPHLLSVSLSEKMW